MGRKPFKSADEKLQVVLSCLRGEMTQVEAARRLQMSQTTIAKCRSSSWRGPTSPWLGDNAEGPRSRREDELQSQVEELTQALGEAYVELRVWRKGGAL
jgi:transposase